MANLHTHLVVGTAMSALAASAWLSAALVTVPQALALTAAGALGSVLPDIDADHSRSGKAMFNAIALLSALLLMVLEAPRLSIVELWSFAILAFLLLRYGVSRLVHALTVHRGVIHSLMAAFVAMLSAAVGAVDLFGRTAAFGWTFGIFLGAGFVLHLLLDELFSVDLEDVKLKRSFGTAFKLIDASRPLASSMMAAALLLLAFLAPPTGGISRLPFNGKSPQALVEHFLPDGPFFKGLIPVSFNAPL